MTGLELFEAAPEPKQLLTYESDPAVDLSEIRIDRLRFLKQALRFNSDRDLCIVRPIPSDAVPGVG
jgi:hypothetical protein